MDIQLETTSNLPNSERDQQRRRRDVLWLAIAIAAIIVITVGIWSVSRREGGLTGAVVPGLDRTGTMQLVVGGVPQELPTEVALSGNLVASIHLETTRDRYGRELAVRLFAEGSPSELITTAEVNATATMQLMDHGAVEARATTPESGAYILPLRFDMAGDWQIDLLIRTGGQNLPLLLYVDVLD